MYNNCQSAHRKKVWSTTQVLMQLQVTESTKLAMQVHERIKPVFDTWLLGNNNNQSTATSNGSSTESNGLNSAFNELFAAISDTIEGHHSMMKIMTSVNEQIRLRRPIKV